MIINYKDIKIYKINKQINLMNSKVFCLILAFALIKIAYTYDCKVCTFSMDGTDNNGPCTPCDEGTCTPFAGTKGNDQSACISRKCQGGKVSRYGYDLDGKGEGCYNCFEGFYTLDGISCDLIPCGYGFYGELGFQNKYSDTKYPQCKKCPDGFSTQKEITKGLDDSVCNVKVKLCPAGKWSWTGYDRDENGTGCLDCLEGTYSEEGSTSCNLWSCGKGYYSATGYYDSNQKNNCQKCPTNKSTLETNTKGNDDSACDLQLRPCPEGKWSETGYDLDGNGLGCQDCWEGTYSEEGSTSCDLKPCGYGFYSATGYYDQRKEFNCQQCPTGKSTLKQNTKGNEDLVCDLQLNLCPKGKWSKTGYDSNGRGEGCNTCEIGTYSLEGSKTCNLRPCGQGFYSKTGYYDADTEDKCQACPENTSTDGIQTQSLDKSVCKSFEINPTEVGATTNNATNSIIIKMTLSFILLVALF
ncbi:hypothetical protein TTHERM_00629990 (macronuclear) [Tetrahymena thermophila SB210]|uniref:GCC2 and GCC3 family protein n=1 Tax=Tetrahymena thermophila (strain SB210) TaxID=312017 RepID=Q241T3_TETTS|nr:hypothetical protein TTHERM_00629990 [Tetrahymena thermophila SB210]EAS02487.3 hypothetical protein TTHERM_00629990 [Tetrahymena thermophila SB210]|eukprot:XP_001022732.3 hypothetical protein TTHERM_00629990 [Tetrahymena thermophila SB210]